MIGGDTIARAPKPIALQSSKMGKEKKNVGKKQKIN